MKMLLTVVGMRPQHQRAFSLSEVASAWTRSSALVEPLAAATDPVDQSRRRVRDLSSRLPPHLRHPRP